ncbi:hypothetical protein [Rhodoferax sp.]|uniref:hypothetical protein n=1 Tax=Rhodoferax sp. TaxID=50421 RepID=UPI00374DA185
MITDLTSGLTATLATGFALTLALKRGFFAAGLRGAFAALTLLVVIGFVAAVAMVFPLKITRYTVYIV